MPQYRILVAMYVHVLTETNHAIRHPVLFCHCGGPHTAKKREYVEELLSHKH